MQGAAKSRKRKGRDEPGALKAARRRQQGHGDGGGTKSSAAAKDGGTQLRVNKEFARKLEAEGREAERLLLERLIRAEERRDSEEGGEEDEEEEEEEEEDEGGQLLTPELDLQIHRTIAAIRLRDESVYDANKSWIRENMDKADVGGESPSRRQKQSRMRIRDMAVQIEAGSADEEEAEQPRLTHVEEQRQIREEFLEAAARDSFEKDAEGLFSVRRQEAPKLTSEDADDKNESTLAELLGDEPGDEDEKFLRSYVLNEWWRERDLSKLPSYREIVGEDEPEQPDVDEDEEALDAQDEFESKYNFRFEEPGSEKIVTYPRHIQDSVRQKDDTRALRREARKKRKEEAAKKRAEELKRLKNEKRREIMAKLEEIRRISGLQGAEDGSGEKEKDGDEADELFDKLARDLKRPFDPDDHDMRMSSIFDDKFYSAPDPELRVDADSDEGDGVVAGMAGLDDEERKEVIKPAKYLHETRKRLEATGKVEISKRLDDLYRLDYEDVIGGDLPVRFKYREVPACTYGMSLEEILQSEDKELNAKVSLKRLAPYREDANEDVPYWKMRRFTNWHQLRKKQGPGANGTPSSASQPHKSAAQKRRERRKRRGKEKASLA